jgi:hypothetical protein
MPSRGEAALLALAARQYGVFTLAQALAAGVSQSTVRRRVREEMWVHLYPCVFTTVGTVDSWQRRLMAALLTCGPDAVASHRSAAVVWGLVEDMHVPEITMPYDRRRTRRGITVHRTRHPQFVSRQRFRVSPPMQTLLELAAVLPVNLLERALDNAHRRGLIELRRFAAFLALPRNLSVPGSGDLRRMVAARSPHAAISSELESEFFAVLRRVNFPLPVPQYRVITPNGRRRYMDFAFPEQRIAIELDSYSEHGGHAPFTADRIRQNEVEAMRWHFFRFTWEMVTADSVAWLVPLADGLGLEPSRWRAKLGTKRFRARAKVASSGPL